MIVRDKIKINILKKFEDNRFLNGKKVFLNNVYVFEFGNGCEKQFLISKKNYRIGINYLCIDLFKENYEIPYYFINRVYRDVSYSKLKDRGYVFGIIRRTDENLDNYNLRELFKKYLLEDSVVDDNLLWIMCGLILRVDSSRIRIQDWMPYAPHGLIFTNTKAGKSSLAQKVGNVLERVSIPRLFGFRNDGDLNGEVATTFLDEIQEYHSSNTFSQILSYEEYGRTTTAKGSKTIVTEGWSPIVYMGNTHSTDKMHELISILNKISYNYEAFLSRKAFLFIKHNCKEREGSREKDYELDAVVEDVVEYYGPIVSNIFIKYKKLLEEKFDDLSYRHINGFALLQTILDSHPTINNPVIQYDTYKKNKQRLIKINRIKH